MINSYLTQTSELDDRAIHLLFSANRWERAFVLSLPSLSSLLTPKLSQQVNPGLPRSRNNDNL